MKKSQSRRGFLKSSALAGSIFMMPGLMSANRSLSPDRLLTPMTSGADDDLSSLGLLDITASPFLADPTGTKDSTKAIQDAVNHARNNRMVCFFPEGTYLISDTISCEQRVQKLDSPRHTDGMRQSWWDIGSDRHFLLGSVKGKRPVLKLSKDAKGFDDPAKPKYAMKIWAQTRNDFPGTHEPLFGVEQPNISFGHILQGIDFDIRGHAGAIGLRHSGSQGSFLMDSAVNAEGAFAGFSNTPGQGGGTYNLEVYGGRYGIYADPDCRFPMLAACCFKGQTVAPVYYRSGNLPMVLVGCYLESNGPAAIDLSDIRFFTGISIVDCIIKMNNGGVIFNKSNEQNVFMENTIVKGAKHVLNSGTKIKSPKKWTEVLRYSTCAGNAQTLINGVIASETFSEMKAYKGEPNPDSIRAKHWSRLPSFEDKDAINIKTAGAAGDGETDDTPALKKVLETHRKIFFPAGSYKLSEELDLPPDVQFFGIRGANINAPSINTFNHPDDKTIFSFISVGGPLVWRSGKGVYAFASSRLNITESGGGRLYAMRGIGRGGDSKLIEGSKQAIAIYTLNVERRTTNPQAYIKNADNVRIYFFKCEASVHGHGVGVAENTGNTPLAIIDSNNVKVYCVNGLVTTAEKRPMMDVVNSRNVLITQARTFQAGDYPQVRETFGDVVNEIPSDRVAALFIRD